MEDHRDPALRRQHPLAALGQCSGQSVRDPHSAGIQALPCPAVHQHVHDRVVLPVPRYRPGDHRARHARGDRALGSRVEQQLHAHAGVLSLQLLPAGTREPDPHGPDPPRGQPRGPLADVRLVEPVDEGVQPGACHHVRRRRRQHHPAAPRAHPAGLRGRRHRVRCRPSAARRSGQVHRDLHAVQPARALRVPARPALERSLQPRQRRADARPALHQSGGGRLQLARRRRFGRALRQSGHAGHHQGRRRRDHRLRQCLHDPGGLPVQSAGCRALHVGLAE